ncbi:hypothetical protein [Sphingomonas albertensis]|uniref:Uncharacterized protein n=1 Tax=Sphingomonas albertensis TaxID=2762591 RepID=A0ABR7AR20_9SPHN|nr:hypothetical protein [Sphingomonas albertensis]MBC3942912.1 hypothetical protein [Sphingomonas albertensis]
MRVIFNDSIDLGFAVAALITGTVDTSEIADWAARVIDAVKDPPTYIYVMLDMERYHGRGLHDEIGFTPTTGVDSEDEFQYLREIAVHRGRGDSYYLGGKSPVSLGAVRKAYIDNLLKINFGFDVQSLPPLYLGDASRTP